MCVGVLRAAGCGTGIVCLCNDGRPDRRFPTLEIGVFFVQTNHSEPPSFTERRRITPFVSIGATATPRSNRIGPRASFWRATNVTHELFVFLLAVIVSRIATRTTPRSATTTTTLCVRCPPQPLLTPSIRDESTSSPGFTMPSPHTSRLQVELQPSTPRLFPSSHSFRG
jgi:hypothetical protein